ncbi:MAG: hypothetical protein EBU52_01635 [Cytophagia bacterium]|nr:hypothetical protein [Cytophagia bacterium]
MLKVVRLNTSSDGIFEITSMKINVTAIQIETLIWEKIIQLLIHGGWTVVYEYDNYDKGIDSDLIILKKNNEKILLGWDNWFEGEIYCFNEVLGFIEEKMKLSFTRGESNGILRQEIINQYEKY